MIEWAHFVNLHSLGGSSLIAMATAPFSHQWHASFVHMHGQFTLSVIQERIFSYIVHQSIHHRLTDMIFSLQLNLAKFYATSSRRRKSSVPYKASSLKTLSTTHSSCDATKLPPRHMTSSFKTSEQEQSNSLALMKAIAS